MAMNAANHKGGPVADVNVTPLIDVLLVLLIIFMVISPLTPKGMEAQIPQPAESPRSVQPQAIVVSVDAEHHISINQQAVALDKLGIRLEDIFKDRSERVLFIKGDPDACFTDVAAILDIAHGAAIDRIGLITKSLN
jgi:biopolymer transport protein TolR